MISQDGKTYLARKWKLSDQVIEIMELAFTHGLTALWQHRHPKGDSSHHISFAFDHSPSSWIFVLGEEAHPPKVDCVTFNKTLKEYFYHSGLSWTWDWETAGGKNILVDPIDVESVLTSLPLDQIRKGIKPSVDAVSASRSGNNYFDSEADLEQAVFDEIRLNRSDVQQLLRQSRYTSNNSFERHSRPDILVVESDRVLILELKLHEASEVELAQLDRYLRNEELAQRFAPRERLGILIASRFKDVIIERAKDRPDIRLVRYAQSPDGSLELEPF